MARTVLSSDWGGLSPHILGTFVQVKMEKAGDPRSFQIETGTNVVRAPIIDAQMEQGANWISPFENQVPDAGFSTFSHMLQVGGLLPVLNALQRVSGAGSTLDSTAEGVASLSGRTSMTLLNSTQVYNGSPPLKISCTAIFRALKDPEKEVAAPINQLFCWLMPEKIAAYGLLTNAISSLGNISDVSEVLRTVYPSKIPSVIGFIYRGNYFMPMVIESMSRPLDSPVDKNGRDVCSRVQMTMASLTSLDRTDYKTIVRG